VVLADEALGSRPLLSVKYLDRSIHTNVPALLLYRQSLDIFQRNKPDLPDELSNDPDGAATILITAKTGFFFATRAVPESAMKKWFASSRGSVILETRWDSGSASRVD